MRDFDLPGDSIAFHDLAPRQESFAAALSRGLEAPRGAKAIPCRFLYDAEGSRLFEAICALPEYYPTRTETAILQACAAEVATLAGPRCQLVELGSGSSAKVRLLLDALDSPAAYVPIDISAEPLRRAAQAIAADYPNLHVAAVCADYAEPFALPEIPGGGRRLGFFPGSTIGNLDPLAAEAFLQLWAHRLGPGSAMLVGVDLKKDRTILEPAYDDAAGVTAAFSLNLLARANRELGADFDLGAFRHRAVWNEAAGRIQIHLVSEKAQSVQACGRTFAFAEGEAIHVEDSCKYDIDAFAALARRAGFDPQRYWTDAAGLFSVHWLEAGDASRLFGMTGGQGR
jgi:dimethylhistidine N-methyltransferase